MQQIADILAKEIVDRCETPADLPRLRDLQEQLVKQAILKFRARRDIAQATGVPERTLYEINMRRQVKEGLLRRQEEQLNLAPECATI